MEVLTGLYGTLHAPLFLAIFGIFLLAYLVFAVGSYAFLYMRGGHALSRMKIQLAKPTRDEITRELFWSVIALFVWSGMAVILVALFQNGYTLLYADIGRYGVPYFILTIFIMIVSHDAYFYWTHRLMHSKIPFFYGIHNIHHTSVNPTPFAVYTFGPSEAILLSLYFFLIAVLIPIHIYALIAFFIVNTAFNAAGHLGYEFFPARIHETPVGKIFNTSTHHNMHHQYGRSNFALYFTFWDSVMKTNDEEYRTVWDALHSRSR